MFSFLCITNFPKRQSVLFEKQWLFIQIIFQSYFIFSIFLIFLFVLFIFIYFYFFIFLFILFFPYFRGNSLNSRADLEFKEIRLFSTMIFQKKEWNSLFFFRKIIVEKEKTIRIFWKNIEFHFFFNHRGKKSKFLKFKVSPWI